MNQSINQKLENTADGNTSILQPSTKIEVDY
jgi:hypothetical protein